MAPRPASCLKLLFIDSSRNGWGTETHFVELVTAVHQAGHDVRAIVRRDSPVDRLLHGSPIPRISTPFRGGSDPRALWQVVREIRRDRPDWIVTSRGKLYWPALVLGLAFDVRVALFRHLAYLKRWPEQRLVPRLADRFYVVSQFAQDVLVEDGAPRERLTPLYNPIDMQRFRPPLPAARLALRERLGLRSSDFVAGFVGRMELGKGVVPLCEAATALMKRHPALRMLWIGAGPEKAALERFAAATGGGARHVFIGWQPRIEDYFGTLDVLVAPSIVPETFGRVVAEAQACGVPVIASAAGGLSEAFQPDRTGLLLERVDTATIAAAIERLIAEPLLRQWLGAHGPGFVNSRFAADKVAQAFVAHLAATPLPAAFDLPPTALVAAAVRTGTQDAHVPRESTMREAFVVAAETPVELQPG
jgi:glycosyltransferase involved in cell wall biosynthesis